MSSMMICLLGAIVFAIIALGYGCKVIIIKKGTAANNSLVRNYSLNFIYFIGFSLLFFILIGIADKGAKKETPSKPNVAIVEKEAALKQYATGFGVTRELAWWMDIPEALRIDAAESFYPFRRVLGLCFHREFDDNGKVPWIDYYKEVVYPNLYQKYSVAWSPEMSEKK